MEFTKNLRSENPIPFKIKQLLAPTLTLATLLSFGSPWLLAQDRITIRPHRIVLKRSADLVTQSSGSQQAIVRYPIISGLADKGVLRKVQILLRLKNLFGSTLQDYRQHTWLEELDYEVHYNKNYLFDITFRQSGSAAYPDTQFKHLLISLRTGNRLLAGDVFEASCLPELARMVDRKLQMEVVELMKAVDDEKDIAADQKQWEKDSLKKLKLTLADLDDFSVSDKGVTFLYDAAFPHVIRALQPDGRYFFTYPELKFCIRMGGPLGGFVTRKNK
jgi:hypothetical protein